MSDIPTPVIIFVVLAVIIYLLMWLPLYIGIPLLAAGLWKYCFRE